MCRLLMHQFLGHIKHFPKRSNAVYILFQVQIFRQGINSESFTGVLDPTQ